MREMRAARKRCGVVENNLQQTKQASGAGQNLVELFQEFANIQ
jgi:hypothetical protein